MSRTTSALNMPSIERRSLMESSMRRKTTRADLAIVVIFIVGLVGLLGYFLTPVIVSLVGHIPDLLSNSGR